jgi:hypothetical protein
MRTTGNGTIGSEAVDDAVVGSGAGGGPSAGAGDGGVTGSGAGDGGGGAGAGAGADADATVTSLDVVSDLRLLSVTVRLTLCVPAEVNVYVADGPELSS